jgi:hypothetical protein
MIRVLWQHDLKGGAVACPGLKLEQAAVHFHNPF